MQLTILPVQLAEPLEDQHFSPEELARSCGMAPVWVQACLSAGVLHLEATASGMRFRSLALVRARRIADLEHLFDADLQLAAMTVDLVEQVACLRARLRALGADPG